MRLTLKRRYKGTDYTIGSLYVNDTYVCDTLEDRDRGLAQGMSVLSIKARKVFGKTAIPTGTYEIDMDTVSTKFKSKMWASPYGGKIPRLLDVKGFSGVLMHVGNTASDSLGCVLVGENRVKGQVINSAKTFKSLMDNHLLPAHKRGEKITITIK